VNSDTNMEIGKLVVKYAKEIGRIYMLGRVNLRRIITNNGVTKTGNSRGNIKR
jgi:hypothetical protein